jgi:hypothetical protein
MSYRNCHLVALQVEEFERIPWRPTLARDLGKRWSAQRLALDP